MSEENKDEKKKRPQYYEKNCIRCGKKFKIQVTDSSSDAYPPVQTLCPKCDREVHGN